MWEGGGGGTKKRGSPSNERQSQELPCYSTGRSQSSAFPFMFLFSSLPVPHVWMSPCYCNSLKGVWGWRNWTFSELVSGGEKNVLCMFPTIHRWPYKQLIVIICTRTCLNVIFVTFLVPHPHHPRAPPTPSTSRVHIVWAH